MNIPVTSGEVSTLNHEVGDDTMEDAARFQSVRTDHIIIFVIN